jgi:hypothetical protein
MPYIGKTPSPVPIDASDIPDDSITSAKIKNGAIVDADVNTSAAIAASKLSATLDLSSKTITLPSASVTAHVTQTDTTVIENNIAMLGFYRAADNSKAVFNMVDSVVDTFTDATGIDTGNSTNETLASGYYKGISGVTGSTVTTAYSYDSSDDTIALSNGDTIAGTIKLWGAAGGGDSSDRYGGGGGFMVGTLSYESDGTDLIVSVGQGGPKGTKAGSGGTGGGYTGLFKGSKTHGNTVMIAGAGGGGGDNSEGGPGGGLIGDPGTGGNYTGQGGSQTAGGSVGSGDSTSWNPTPGSALQGGQGGANADPSGNPTAYNGGGMQGEEPGGYVAGGGGGGGYYGGGGGYAGSTGGSGGGGSSYHNTSYITSATNTQGTLYTGAGQSDGNYPGSGIGNSADGTVGGNGAAWISYAITSSVAGDLTLQSTATTAETTPTTGDIVMLLEDAAGTATLNTDIKGYVSRDGGTTWTQGTLTDEGGWGTNKKVLAFHNLDISAQPSGTSMKYKVTTHNQSASKETRVHATSLAWA